MDRVFVGSAKHREGYPFARCAGSRDHEIEPVRSFQTVSGRGILRSPQRQATPYIRRMSVAPSLATIYACSLLCNECGGADESRPSLLSAYLTLRRDGAASAADIVPGVRCRATGREQGREYGGASAGRLET